MSDSPFHHLRDFKVIVTFHPIGSAPRLKVSRFTIDGTLTIAELTSYVNKMLNIDSSHLYFNQSIELMPNQYVGDFVKIFGKTYPNGDPAASVNIHYSIGRAYL